MRYVAIEGVIGVGKTTLARTLVNTHSNAKLVLEIVEENPFLSDFYQDRQAYGFQTQIFFLLSRFRQQKELAVDLIRHDLVVSDYLFDKDLIFARQNLAFDELDMHHQLFEVMNEKVPTPDLVIYLRGTTDTLMQRIALRDRPFEREMDRQYIDSLNQAYEQFFAGYRATPLMVIDTNRLNLVANDAHINWVIDRVVPEEVLA